MEFPFVLHALTKKLVELQEDKKSEKPAEKDPGDCDAAPARQEPGNTAGPCEA